MMSLNLKLVVWIVVFFEALFSGIVAPAKSDVTLNASFSAFIANPSKDVKEEFAASIVSRDCGSESPVGRLTIGQDLTGKRKSSPGIKRAEHGEGLPISIDPQLTADNFSKISARIIDPNVPLNFLSALQDKKIVSATFWLGSDLVDSQNSRRCQKQLSLGGISSLPLTARCPPSKAQRYDDEREAYVSDVSLKFGPVSRLLSRLCEAPFYAQITSICILGLPALGLAQASLGLILFGSEAGLGRWPGSIGLALFACGWMVLGSIWFGPSWYFAFSCPA